MDEEVSGEELEGCGWSGMFCTGGGGVGLGGFHCGSSVNGGILVTWGEWLVWCFLFFFV